MTRQPRKRSRLLIATILLALGALVAWAYGLPFDRAVWHGPHAVSSGDRLWMVNDLKIRHLRGLTREQVIDLLGPSDDPPAWQPEIRMYPAWDLVYHLGIVDPFFMIGPGVLEGLFIRFGPDGRVAECRIGHEWKFR